MATRFGGYYYCHYYHYFLLLLLGDYYYITFMIFLQIIILWLISTVLGIAAFPLLFSILPGLKDRGYSISRVVGLVLVTFLSWLLSSLKIFPFGTASVIFSLLCLICLSLWAGYRNRGELLAFLKKEFKLLLLIELIFLVALIVLLLIVALNPNIDPETERFMDYALLNSIDRTDYFPPLDPWIAGKIMNYYYYGFIFVSTLHKLIPIPLTTFFNMALALIYALFYPGLLRNRLQSDREEVLRDTGTLRHYADRKSEWSHPDNEKGLHSLLFF